MYRGGGDVRHEANEVHAPHRGVFPGIQNVAKSCRLFERCEAFCWIVAEDPLENLSFKTSSKLSGSTYIGHDNFFAFAVPWPAPENAFCMCWGVREIEVALSKIQCDKSIAIPEIFAWVEYEEVRLLSTCYSQSNQSGTSKFPPIEITKTNPAFLIRRACSE